MRLTCRIVLVISALALGIAPLFATDIAPAAPSSGKTPNERLIEAARDGHLDEVNALLREGAKVDARTDSFATPLILAASTGNVAIVQALLKAGADVNALSGSALMYAAGAGNITLVRILLDAKAQVNLKDGMGQTALHFAARAGNIEVMELLLAAGADMSAKDDGFFGTPLHHAAVGGHANAVRCLLKHGCPVNLPDNDGSLPLHFAVTGGSNDVIKALLDGGADINEPSTSEGQTPLMWAAQDSTHIAALQFLIQCHADVNKTDAQGWTALMLAKRSGQNELVKILKQAGGEERTNLSYSAAIGDLATVQSLLAKQGINRPKQKELDDALGLAARERHADITKELLAHDANPNLRFDGDRTPLLFACMYSGVDIARQLLAAGADPNLSRGLNANTPLMSAAHSMSPEFVEELISKGAQVNVTTKDGDTAAGWAAFGGKLENMKILVQHGTKLDIHAGKAEGYPGWPFFRAVSRGDITLVDYLLSHGGSINDRSEHGKTPLMYAVQCNQPDIAKLLIARGADVSAQADYDYNNTVLKLAENTGKIEIAALLRILEFDGNNPSDTHHWGKKLVRALSESTQAQIDNRPSNNTALIELTKEIVTAPNATQAMKTDARYLAAVVNMETLRASGPVSNAVARAAVEAAIVELRKNYPDDVRTTMVLQQWDALQQRKTGMREASAQTPVDLKFQAVDGSNVDTVKLRGKVILVDFWATWCGPCCKEVPHVVATYNQLHKDGFEVIGISLDQNRERLTNFTKQAGMAWPQYFDGKGWESEIASRYGIQSIPAMWLVDKKGFVRSTSAQGDDLAAQVKKLLAE